MQLSIAVAYDKPVHVQVSRALPVSSPLHQDEDGCAEKQDCTHAGWADWVTARRGRTRSERKMRCMVVVSVERDDAGVCVIMGVRVLIVGVVKRGTGFVAGTTGKCTVRALKTGSRKPTSLLA
jgi:hypothetical protein